MRRFALAISIIALLSAIGISVVVLVFDVPDAVRPLLVNRLEAATGRKVSIGTDLEMRYSFTPTVTAGNVTLANAPWGSRPNMLVIDQLDVQIQLLPLLFDRELVIDRLHLAGVDLLLERNESGIGNWRFKEPAEQPPGAGGPADAQRRAPPFLADVAIDDALLTWHDLTEDESRTVQLDSLYWTAESTTAPVEIGAQGEWQARPFDVAGTVGAMRALLAAEGEWPVDVSGTFAGSQIAVAGALGLGDAETELQVAASGDRISAVADSLGVQAPALGPYDVQAMLLGVPGAFRLTDIQGTAGQPEGLALSVADGNVNGLGEGADMTIPFRARTKQLAQAAALFNLPMPALGGAVVSGELTRNAQSAFAVRDLSAEIGQGANRLALTGEIAGLPDDATLDLSVDAELERLSILDAIGGANLPPAGPVSLTAQVSGGWPELTFSDLAVRLDENSVTGRLTVNPTATPPSLRGRLSSERFDVAALMEDLASDEADANQEDGGLPVDALNGLAADLDLSVQTLLLAGREVGPANARLQLQDGQLALRDIDLRVMGGAVSGSAVAEAEPTEVPARPVAQVDLRLRAEDLDLGSLIRARDQRPASDLEIDVELTANSAGRTVDELLAELEGDAEAIAEGGRLQGTQIDRLVQDLDPVRLLQPFWRRAEVVNINCIVADMDIAEGVADSQLMLDTRRMTVLGEGTINLRDRQLDLLIEPKPKSRALSAQGVPVEVTGPISSPQVRPRPGETAARLFGGLVGGLLVPLNQIARIFGEEARDACASALESSAAGNRSAADE